MRGDRYELKAAHDTRIMWLLGYLQVSTVRESRGAFLPPPGGVTDLRSVTLNFSLRGWTALSKARVNQLFRALARKRAHRPYTPRSYDPHSCR